MSANGQRNLSSRGASGSNAGNVTTACLASITCTRSRSLANRSRKLSVRRASLGPKQRDDGKPAKLGIAPLGPGQFHRMGQDLGRKRPASEVFRVHHVYDLLGEPLPIDRIGSTASVRRGAQRCLLFAGPVVEIRRVKIVIRYGCEESTNAGRLANPADA